MINNNPDDQNSYCNTFILGGSISDLSRINVDFWGFNIINLAYLSSLQKYFRLHSTRDIGYDDNLEAFEKIKADYWDNKNMYLITPVKFDKIIPDEEYYRLWQALSIIFPSDLQVISEIHYQIIDEKIYRTGWATWDLEPTGDASDYENFLRYEDEQLDEIEKCLRLFYEKRDTLNYLQITISSFFGGHIRYVRHLYLMYVSLCISLESIVSGHQELSYRLCRNVAILCGKSIEECHRIFKNTKKLYEIRSQIVHGAKLPYKTVLRYLPYLKALVSRMIIELLVHAIPDKEELNNRLTSLGFGDFEKISSDYNSIIPNNVTFTIVSAQEL